MGNPLTKTNRSKAIAIGCALIIAGTSMSLIPSNTGMSVEAAADCNYAKGLQYSMYLYDANMCGTEVGEKSAMNWRDDCHTVDANASTPYGTVDVSGGYHDAGDHVKFGLPQAYSASILGWGYYEFKDAYTQTGQADHMKAISTYFADYFKKCTIMENGKVTAFCYQVGEGTSDHEYWGAPENQTTNRPTYWATSSNPATDIVSNTVGALAFHYKNFGDAESLTYAKALYEFAKNNNKQVASEGIGNFYASDSYIDDLMWAAAALYTVTGDTSYVTDANQFLNDTGDAYKFCSDWPLCWGNMWPVVNLIFGQLDSGFTNNQHPDWGSLNSQMKEQVEKTMTSFQSKTTLDGTYVCFDNWGSARYNTAMQLVGLAYDKINGTNKYGDWAKSQMDYLMGNNNKNQCYITGFNSNSVTNPHHRAASGLSEFPKENTTITMGHTLIGALVGGPKQDNTYQDQISQYEYTEVALDYNAGFVGAMAGLYLKYGSGQSVDSSIEGVGATQPNVSVTTTATTTPATTSTTSTTSTTTSVSNTTTEPSYTTTSVTSTSQVVSGGNNVLSKTEFKSNNDGTDTFIIYVNTKDSTSVDLTLQGLSGYTTSGMVGYWDNNAQKWVDGIFDWSEQKFDSNGNLTISNITVPANTNDVQIMITYYANWATGSEVLGDKSQIKVVSATDKSSTNNTTTTTYATSTPQNTTAPSTNGENIVSQTEIKSNDDGTDTFVIHVNTKNSTSVDVTLQGLSGYTTSGEVGYWDNNAQKWVGKVDTWEEQKFDSNGNLTISNITVPANTNDVQIMITYYANWATGSEVLGDKSQIKVVSVTDKSSTNNTTTTTKTSVNTTPQITTTPSTSGENIVSQTEIKSNDDGTDTFVIHVNTKNSTSVDVTLQGLSGYTTSGEVGYWDNNAQKWVGKVDTWEEQKFDSNGNLTISGIKVPANTNDVQIMITYYANWATGSEVLGDKSQIKVVSVTDKSSNPTSSSTTTTRVTTINTTVASSTTVTTSGSTNNSTVLGDVTGDGKVMGNDLLMLKKYVLGLTDLDAQALKNADVSGDGNVMGNDLLILKKYVLGLTSTLG